MKGFVKLTLLSSMLFTAILFAREKAAVQIETDAGIVYDGKEYVLTQPENQSNSMENREEIILWEEDFENNAEENPSPTPISHIVLSDNCASLSIQLKK